VSTDLDASKRHDGEHHRPDVPTPSRLRPRFGYVALGTVVALLLAIVLFVGIGGGGGTGSGSDVVPGVNQSAASLIDLSVLSHVSPRRPAPNFTLTDQYGRQTSLDAYRGKVVVLSFNDDRCPDLCTLLAQDIVVANRDMGALAKQVVFLSVNVNPYYPQISTVKAWTDQHGLGHQTNWVFTTGTPAQLRAVWKLYGTYVQLDPASQTVTHSAALFFIDPQGYERDIASFGTNAANTSLYAHDMAQVAVDQLPSGGTQPVGGPETATPSQSDAAVGAHAPTFELPMLASHQRLSLSSLHGKYVVLNFWASTCTACTTEMPHMEAAYRDLGAQVPFVGIDVSDNTSAALAFAHHVGVTYPLVSDGSGSAAGAYQVSGLPFTAILSPKGKLLVRHPGAMTTEQLEYILKNLDPSLGAG
jgi:cytochrome oxidase Cu insertion factor (SCO1/SenC/PrrC family)